MTSALAPGWPLWLDPDSPEGRRFFVEQLNAHSNGAMTFSLKDGRDGISVVSFAEKRAERANRIATGG
jgi:hypothetical protein